MRLKFLLVLVLSSIAEIAIAFDASELNQAVHDKNRAKVDELLSTSDVRVSVGILEARRHPVVIAGKVGDIEILKRLTTGIFEINAVDSYGNSALHEACTAGNIDVVKYLIERKAELMLPNCAFQTPSLIAYQKGHMEIVDLLAKSIKMAGSVERYLTLESALFDCHYPPTGGKALDTGRRSEKEAFLNKLRELTSSG